MPVIILQLVVSILVLSFGLSGILVGRSTGVSIGIQREGWLFIGLSFTLSGASQIMQSIWAAVAYFSGAGTGVYDSYLRFAPMANHGRSGLEVALGVGLLVWVVAGERGDRFWTVAVAIQVVGFLLGSATGFAEGSLTESRHYPAVALLDAVAMFTLFAALLVSLKRSTFDRMLWLALFGFSVLQAFNVIWFSAISWFGQADVWTPRSWVIQSYMTIAISVLLGLSLIRLSLARRGVHVPTLLEPLAVKRAASLY